MTAARARGLQLAVAWIVLAALPVLGGAGLHVAAAALAWTVGTPAALLVARSLRPATTTGVLGRVRRVAAAVGWAMALPVVGALAVAWSPGLLVLAGCGIPALTALAVGLGAAAVDLLRNVVRSARDGSGLAPHHR